MAAYLVGTRGHADPRRRARPVGHAVAHARDPRDRGARRRRAGPAAAGRRRACGAGDRRGDDRRARWLDARRGGPAAVGEPSGGRCARPCARARLPHEHEHDHAPSRDAAGDVHSHGGVAHSHVPSTGSTLSWRGLFALGLAGGLIPSTSALFILLGSIVAGRPAFGLVLVVIFGLGMAVVMTAVGLVVVLARGRLDSVPTTSGPGRVRSTAAARRRGRRADVRRLPVGPGDRRPAGPLNRAASSRRPLLVGYAIASSSWRRMAPRRDLTGMGRGTVRMTNNGGAPGVTAGPPAGVENPLRRPTGRRPALDPRRGRGRRRPDRGRGPPCRASWPGRDRANRRSPSGRRSCGRSATGRSRRTSPSRHSR